MDVIFIVNSENIGASKDLVITKGWFRVRINFHHIFLHIGYV